MKVHGHQPLPPTTTVNYLPQNVCPNLLKVSVGLESLPAEGSEPGQVVGVVHVVANSNNLMETLDLNTHHLQDTKGLKHLLSPQFLRSVGTETSRS